MGANVKSIVIYASVLAALTALALFIPAGTLNWPAGWLFLLLFIGFFVVMNFWMLRYNPGLLNERMHLSSSNQAGWDRFIFPLLSLFPIVWIAFTAFDVNHLRWTPVSTGVQGVGLIVLLFSFYLFFLTFRENTYLSSVVRIQEDRGHSVVSTGPYHYVRHPMYAGIVAFTFGTPLLLGSWSGVIVGLILIAILARRAVLEERTLQRDLRGYSDYMAQVRYRFIPYVW